MYFVCSLLLLAVLSQVSSALNVNNQSSVVGYWGLDSSSDVGYDNQKRLANYCKSSNNEVVVLSSVIDFNTSGWPIRDFSKFCSDGEKSNDADLKHCSQMEMDIQTCQKNGVKVLLSVGGFNVNSTLDNEDSGSNFAFQLWNAFGGGEDIYRPFGKAVVDGFNLEVNEDNNPANTAFAKQLFQIFASNPDHRYHLSAATPIAKVNGNMSMNATGKNSFTFLSSHTLSTQYTSTIASVESHTAVSATSSAPSLLKSTLPSVNSLPISEARRGIMTESFDIYNTFTHKVPSPALSSYTYLSTFDSDSVVVFTSQYTVGDQNTAPNAGLDSPSSSTPIPTSTSMSSTFTPTASSSPSTKGPSEVPSLSSSSVPTSSWSTAGPSSSSSAASFNPWSSAEPSLSSSSPSISSWSTMNPSSSSYAAPSSPWSSPMATSSSFSSPVSSWSTDEPSSSSYAIPSNSWSSPIPSSSSFSSPVSSWSTMNPSSSSYATPSSSWSSAEPSSTPSSSSSWSSISPSSSSQPLASTSSSYEGSIYTSSSVQPSSSASFSKQASSVFTDASSTSSSSSNAYTSIPIATSNSVDSNVNSAGLWYLTAFSTFRIPDGFAWSNINGFSVLMPTGSNFNKRNVNTRATASPLPSATWSTIVTQASAPN